ncbi:hypothetical protein BH11ARM1_BH11ARM1_17670 [soil metagenome]
MKHSIFLCAALAISAAAIGGCDSGKTEVVTKLSSGADDSSAAAKTPDTSSSYDSSMAKSQLGTEGAGESATAKNSVDMRKPKDGEEVAVLTTKLGKIVVMFFPDKAPGHVKNFKDLIKKGFYDGTRFHRTIPGFMIQGGDPNTKKDDRGTWGQGGPGYSIKAEFNDVHHAKGILSMARSQDPDSAGSQFFLMVGDAPFLDHQYTGFGKIVMGQDIADKIVAMPADGELAKDPVAITKATLEKWPVKK